MSGQPPPLPSLLPPSKVNWKLLWTVLAISLKAIFLYIGVEFADRVGGSVANGREEPAPILSDAEKIELTCKYLNATVGNKPIADISVNDLKLLETCRAIGK